MKIAKIILTIALMLLSLCSCNSKEYHERSKILLIQETTNSEQASSETSTETSKIIDSSNSSTVKVQNIVYFTKSGKRYHYINNCGKGTYYECTIEEAKEKGLTPCKKCVK